VTIDVDAETFNDLQPENPRLTNNNSVAKIILFTIDLTGQVMLFYPFSPRFPDSLQKVRTDKQNYTRKLKIFRKILLLTANSLLN